MTSRYSLDENNRQTLLTLANDAIAFFLEQEALVDPCLDGVLGQPLGAFVSLYNQGQLRGCIGTFAQTDPLAITVRDMAIAAATQDPRFLSVTRDELNQLSIEISVLSPRNPISNPAEIVVGSHGLCVSNGYKRGVLLPQVATENGWETEEFLAHTCRKAGLPYHAWKDPQTRIEIFSADVFSNKYAFKGGE